MTDVTVLTIGPADLRRMIREEAARAVREALPPQTDTMGVKDLAAHYGVSSPTILARERRGELPKRHGRHWIRADVQRWDSERAL